MCRTCTCFLNVDFFTLNFTEVSGFVFFKFALLNSTIQSGKLSEMEILGFLVLKLILKENESCVFINQLLYGYRKLIEFYTLAHGNV